MVAATALTGCADGTSETSGKTTANAVSEGTARTVTATSMPVGSPVQVPGMVGYLFTEPGAIAYLQWQPDSSGSFTGTMLNAGTKGTPPNETVSTSTAQIDGRINGTTFTLDANGHADMGILSGDTLVLNVVQNDGSIQAITYRQVATTDYNAALAELQQTAQNANTQVQRQQSQTSLQATAQDALKSLEADDSSFTNAKTVRSDLAQADNDLQKERQDAANGNGDNCYNITSVVGYDATSVVGYDVTSSASYDVDQENSSITAVRFDIQAVQSAAAALAAAGLPVTPGASDALATAQAQDAEAVATTNKAIDSLNADLTAAYSVANGAGTGPCAGTGPGSPPDGLSHIS